MTEQMSFDDYGPHTHARSSDPVTSKVGAHVAKLRAGTHKHLLLRAYLTQPRGLTDEEAAEACDLLSVGYWKRCSDLRNDGLLKPVLDADGKPLTRLSRNGVTNMVCRITDRGLATLAAMKETNDPQRDSVRVPHVHSCDNTVPGSTVTCVACTLEHGQR